MNPPVLPGSAIGVLGSGQLGRMFAIAARQMGYRVHTFSPESDTPTGQVADEEVSASYSDADALRQFARKVKVITFEFENIPADSIRIVKEFVPVFPSENALYVSQHRIREKNFLKSNKIPVTPFREVGSLSELESAAEELGRPFVLKTAGFGYDGKGQRLIKSTSDIPSAWESLNGQPSIAEAFVDFRCELSVIGVRGRDGSFSHFGVMMNEHRNHILDVTVTPPRLPLRIQNEAIQIARKILTKLDVVGVMCVEMFLTKKGKLLVNELAPRPHNSGHLTIDAFATSQFEQQVRAVCGLPLGKAELRQPAAMANLLGDLWSKGEPKWQKALKLPNVKLHLYGKTEPRPGRKMGHLTATAATGEKARRLALAARRLLTAPK